MYPQSLVCLACFPEIPFWKVFTDVHWDWFSESEELLAQESIRPKANAKIVGKKRNFSFFIEPQVCAGHMIIYSNWMNILHNSVEIIYLQTCVTYIIFTLKSSCKNTNSLMARVLRSILQERCGYYFECVWLWRISGDYSQEVETIDMY